MEIVHSDEDDGKLAFLRDTISAIFLLFILIFSFFTFLFSIHNYLAKNQNRYLNNLLDNECGRK